MTQTISLTLAQYRLTRGMAEVSVTRGSKQCGVAVVEAPAAFSTGTSLTASEIIGPVDESSITWTFDVVALAGPSPVPSLVTAELCEPTVVPSEVSIAASPSFPSNCPWSLSVICSADAEAEVDVEEDAAVEASHFGGMYGGRRSSAMCSSH